MRFTTNQAFFLLQMAVFAVCLSQFPAHAEERIVLATSIRPYVSPSTSSPALAATFAYPKKIRGLLLEKDPADKHGRLIPQWFAVEWDGKRGFLPEPYLVQVSALSIKGNLAIGEEVVDKDNPLPLDYAPSDLVELDKRWNYHAGGSYKLRHEAAQQIARLLSAAADQGFHLRIASGYRSAATQRYNYLQKIKAAGLDQRVVAKPGHSEHQLGTAVDLSGLNPQTSLKPEFAATKEGKWVRQNCRIFGFVVSYTEENSGRTGIIAEPWHVRYLGAKAHIWGEDD